MRLLFRTLLNGEALGCALLVAAATFNCGAEPVALQNPTATLSQSGGWNVSLVTDGITNDFAGWAGYNFGTAAAGPETAVVETVSNVGFPTGSALTFVLYHVNHNPQHGLGKFRLSYTTDARDTFADGANSGGDVTANWTVLNPESASATGGEIMTLLGDGSVLVSGANPVKTVYTVVAKTLVQGITGFRLEALEDPSLPSSGPGRYSNGNFVLTELTVDVVALPPPNPPASAFDLSSGFSALNNPNGPWAYGWVGSLGGAFTALTVPHTSTADGGALVPSWQLTSGQTPAVYRNTNSNTVTAGGGLVSFAPGDVWYYPGENGRPENFGVIRFTAPSNGLYQIETGVRPVYTSSPQGDTDFHVLKNGVELFAQFLSPSNSAAYSNTVALVVGDSIDFAIGRGADGSQHGSGLRIRAALTSTGMITPPPACLTPAVGLTAWFRFEGNAAESVGGGVGVLAGTPSFGSGHVGQALQFDGINDSVRIPASSALDVGVGSGVTIEFWMNPTQPAAQSALLEWSTTVGPEPGLHLFTSVFASGSLFANLIDINGVAHHFTTPGGVLTAGAYQHVAFTYDRASGLARFYVNGNQAAEANMGNLTLDTRPDLWIGRRILNSPAYWFKGAMDEISIYNRALEATEVQAVHEIGIAGKCPSANPPLLPVVANYSLGRDFSATNNPNGPWAYGWEGSLGGAFTLLSVQHLSPAGNGVVTPSWQLTSFQTPAVYHNPTTNTAIFGNNLGTLIPNGVLFYPGENGRSENFGVIRFTAPSNGTYRVETDVAPGYDGPPQGDTDFHVLKNGTEIFGQFLPTTATASYSNTVTLTSGETIDFVIGRGADGNSTGSGLKIAALLTPVGAWVPTPDCVPAASGLVGWWPLEGNATDAASDGDGVLSGSPATGGGRVGQALQFDGIDDLVRIPASSALNVGAGNGFTVEGWINPADLAHLRPIAEWNTGVHFWTGVDTAASGDGERSLFGNIIDASGVNHHIHTPKNVLTTGQWQHVAISYDKLSGAAAIYLNGVVAAQTNLGTFTPLTTGDLYFGNRPSGPFSGIYWKGGLDEMSLYSHALAAADIQSIYSAGEAGKCSLPPEPTNCPAPAGLVSWWPLNSNAVDVVSGNVGHPVGNPVYANGKVGRGLKFDGSDDAVRVPASSSLNVGAGAGLTIEMWINPTQVHSHNALLEWSTPAGPEPGLHLYTSVLSSGSLFVNLVDINGVAHHFTSASGVLEAGVFQHIAFSYDKASGVARFYVNGVQVAEQNMGSLTVDTRPDLWIGQRILNGPAYLFAGVMDEISIYSRALTSAEILSVHTAGSAGKCPPTSPPPVNHAPVAKMSIEPQFTLWADSSNVLVIAGNGVDAELNFDGSLSSDEDGDALVYHWLIEGEAAPFASGVLATNRLELGEHSLVLVVDDSQETGQDVVSVEVITLSEAVDEVILYLKETELSRKDKRPLLATLDRVWESFDHGRLNAAIRQLGSFQQKVRAQLHKHNPKAAIKLIRAAEQIIDAATAALEDDADPKHSDKK